MNLRWAAFLTIFATLAGAVFGSPAAASPAKDTLLPSEEIATRTLVDELVFELELFTNLESPTIFLVGRDGASSPKTAERLEGALEALKGELFERGFRPSIVSWDLFSAQIRDRIEPQGEEQTLPAAAVTVGVDRSQGRNRIQIRGISPEIDPIVVSYVDKDWVSREAQAPEKDAKGHLSLVGHSLLEGEESEAKRAALSRAAEKFRETVLGFVDTKSHWWDFGASSRLRNHIAELLPDAIIKRSYVKDSYLETVDKPYGPVYRAHVLLVAEPDEFREVAEESWVRAARDRNLGILKVVLALLAGPALFLVYLGLDSATRGYLSWPLRLGGFATYGATLWLLFQGGQVLSWLLRWVTVS